MNIDAWRLDVCNEVDHVFWRKFRERVLLANPETYILGEVWHDGLPWLMGDQFDAVMNYPLGDAIKDYFITNYIDAEKFKYMINQISVNYPIQVVESTFNLLDSHDTPRILTVANGNKDKVKLAFLFMFTQVGAPCIYYGTEVGMEGNQGMGQEFHRRCMIWDESKQDKEMFKFMQRLISIKKEYKQFSSVNIDWIQAKKDGDTLIYRKENITIIINNSNEKAEVKLPEYLKNSKGKDLFKLENVELTDKLNLNAYEFKVILN